MVDEETGEVKSTKGKTRQPGAGWDDDTGTVTWHTCTGSSKLKLGKPASRASPASRSRGVYWIHSGCAGR